MAILLTGLVWGGVSRGRAAEAKPEKPTDEPAAKTASAASQTKPSAGLVESLWNWAAGRSAPAPSDAKKRREEAMKKAMEEARQSYEREKRELRERLSKDPRWQPSHEEVGVIAVNKETTASTIHSFCLNKDGNLLVCCGGNPRGGSSPDPRKNAQPGEILLFGPEGKKLGAWKLPIEPQAICLAGDGTVFVAGAGRLCKLGRDGKVLFTADAPHVAELPPDPRTPEKKAEPSGKDAQPAEEAKQKQIAELRKKLQETQKEFQQTLQKAAKGLDPNDEAAMDAYQAKIREPLENLRAMQEKLAELQEPPESLAKRLRVQREQRLTMAGMAVTDRDLFVACRSAKGYGYTVWRTDRDFRHPKKLVENLRGCCGQMDIQAKDGELWVAHNGKHKVERYDRDGKKLSSFGKRDRINAEGFGGCCEPKNLRFAAGGELFASESGPPTCVKRFTAAGEFLGVAVVAPWDSGCVRVTTEFSGRDDKFFVLNTGARTIHVFAKKSPAKDAPKTAAAQRVEK